jgi:hypothetical protein
MKRQFDVDKLWMSPEKRGPEAGGLNIGPVLPIFIVPHHLPGELG